MATCFLAQFAPESPCDGRLVKAHLIPQQQLRKAKLPDSHRTWVWACGGAMGVGGHHGMLDYSRTLKIPRAKLPADVEEFAAEHGIGWYLDREYGEVEDTSAHIHLLSRMGHDPYDGPEAA